MIAPVSMRFFDVRVTAVVLAAIAFITVAGCCGDASRTAGRYVSGDTTYVVSGEPVGWTEERQLTEVLRIGRDDGLEEELIGSVQCVRADASGGIYFFDGSVPALRYFDADGKYVRTLGAEGEGPGEYQDSCLGIAIRSDGKVLLREPRNRRVNVYAPDGSPLESWHVDSGLFTSRATRLDANDNLYLKAIIGEIERNEAWPVGLFVYSPEGVLTDSIAPPAPVSGAAPVLSGNFLPGNAWDITPVGGIVTANSGIYAMEIRRPDGRVVRIERPYEPVRLHQAERAAWQAMADWMEKTQGQFMTADMQPIPAVKSAFRSLFVDDDGRIWVQLYVEAERRDADAAAPAAEDGEGPPRIDWVEPLLYEVFDADGDYLGRVRAPRGANLEHVRGDRAWGTQSEDGRRYVVSWQIE